METTVEYNPTERDLLNKQDDNIKRFHTKHEKSVTSIIGEFGTWQLILCVTTNLIKIAVCWHQLAIIFLAPNTEYWCASEVSTNHSCFHDGGTACTTWEYNRTVFTETIVSEWNLVCGREVYAYAAQSLFMFGSLLGNLIFGVISDKFGRKGPFQITIILMIVFGIATAFAPSLGLFLLFRFIDAFATGGAMIISFVIALEVVGPSWRSSVTVISQLLFVLGHLTLPGLSYCFRNWRHFQLAISIPPIVILMFYWTMPQSPQWLISVGRVNEAMEILRKAALANKLPLIDPPERQLLRNKQKYSEKITHQGFFDLFRHSNLRKRIVVITLSWFVSAMCYFGLWQLLGRLKGDVFSHVAVGGAIQIPGVLIGLLSLERLGRRGTLVGAHIISGLSCVGLALIPMGINTASWLELVVIAIAVTSLLVTFSVNFLFAGELFPTVIRTAAIGLCSTVGRVGSIAAPFVLGATDPEIFIPLLVFGCTGIVAGLISLLLPETRNTYLIDTIEESKHKPQTIIKEKIYYPKAIINKEGLVVFDRQLV